MKAHVTRPDGTTIDIEGKPADVAKVLTALAETPQPVYVPAPYVQPWYRPYFEPSPWYSSGTISLTTGAEGLSVGASTVTNPPDTPWSFTGTGPGSPS